jgi:hypothetical protein
VAGLDGYCGGGEAMGRGASEDKQAAAAVVGDNGQHHKPNPCEQDSDSIQALAVGGGAAAGHGCAHKDTAHIAQVVRSALHA